MRITVADNHMKILGIEKRLTRIEYMIGSFWIPIIVLIAEKLIGS